MLKLKDSLSVIFLNLFSMILVDKEDRDDVCLGFVVFLFFTINTGIMNKDIF